MPLPDKAKIGAAVGEEIVAACDSQNAVSRFSQSGRRNAATALALKKIREQMEHANEIELPRMPTIAAGRTAVHVIQWRQGEAVEVIAIPWEHLAVDVHAGLFWTRVLLVDRVEQRSAQVWIGRIMAGRKATLRALTEQASATV